MEEEVVMRGSRRGGWRVQKMAAAVFLGKPPTLSETAKFLFIDKGDWQFLLQWFYEGFFSFASNGLKGIERKNK